MTEATFESVSQEMLDVGKKESLSAIAEELRPSTEKVRAAAQELVNYALSLQTKYGVTVADQLATLNTENMSTVLNFSRKYVQQKSEYRELMTKVFNFQNIVNEFLGQRIIMTFVAISPVSGKVTLYNMDNSVDDLVIGQAAASKGGNVVGRMSSMEKIKSASKLITKSDSTEINKQSLDNTFQEVWQRYRISKNKIKMGGAAYIMWYLGTWDGVWISGAGPLGEAYVAFFLNDYLFSNNIEPSVKDFMLNEEYGSIKADNASGFLKGDVVKDAAQFGVKIKGAQPLGYRDIIAYANEMLAASDITTYLQNLSKKLEDKASHNMVKPLTEMIEQNYQSLIGPLEDRIQKIGSSYGSHWSTWKK